MSLSDPPSYTQNPDVIATAVNGEVVLLHPADWDYFEFNKVGSAIWGLLAAPRTTDELVAALMAAFDVERGRCHDETVAMLAQLEAHGLIIRN